MSDTNITSQYSGSNQSSLLDTFLPNSVTTKDFVCAEIVEKLGREKYDKVMGRHSKESQRKYIQKQKRGKYHKRSILNRWNRFCNNAVMHYSTTDGESTFSMSGIDTLPTSNNFDTVSSAEAVDKNATNGLKIMCEN